jgi:hypothetical protein
LVDVLKLLDGETLALAEPASDPQLGALPSPEDFTDTLRRESRTCPGEGNRRG